MPDWVEPVVSACANPGLPAVLNFLGGGTIVTLGGFGVRFLSQHIRADHVREFWRFVRNDGGLVVVRAREDVDKKFPGTMVWDIHAAAELQKLLMRYFTDLSPEWVNANAGVATDLGVESKDSGATQPPCRGRPNP